MPGVNELPDNYVGAALERVQRVERAMSLVSRVVNLELADLALNPAGLDEATREQLKSLGGLFVQLSSTGMTVASEIANTLGEDALESPQQKPVEVPAHVSAPAQQPVPVEKTVQPEPLTTPVPQPPKPAPPVIQPPAVSSPAQPTVTSQEGSRLDRVQHGQDAGESSGTPNKRRRTKKQFEGELYEAIVPENTTPLMELREGMTPINLKIIADDAILIEGTKIKLEGDGLFIFNALMRLRNGFITSKAIRELGFRPGTSDTASSQALIKTLTALRTELKNAAGIEIIKKIGDKMTTKYAVNPALVLTDERVDIPAADDGSETVKKN